MENTPQGSIPHSLTIQSDSRLLAMCTAVAEGLTVRVAITRFFGSKAEYYATVSMADKLFIRRLSQERANGSRNRVDGSLVKVSVFLESTRHEAVGRRTEQLSIQRGRLVTMNEYVNALIAADLRTTIDSN